MSEAVDRAQRWIDAEAHVAEVVLLGYEEASKGQLTEAQRATIRAMGKSIVRMVRRIVEAPDRDESQKNGRRYDQAKAWWSK